MTDTRPDRLAIRVVSSFTATPVSSALTFWASQLGLSPELSFAPYGQVFQELHRHGRDARMDAVAVLLRMEDFVPTDRPEAGASVGIELATTLVAAAQRSPSTTFLVAVCPPSPAVGDDPRHLHAVDKATHALRDQGSDAANIRWLEPKDVLERYAVSRADDLYSDRLGNIPYTPEYFAALGTALIRRLYAATTQGPKVLVVDGDNTLWDGVLGEDGPTGVSVGLARQQLQEFLIEQRRVGRLLCLCTKNDLADVKEAVATVPGMRLTLDDFVYVRANWLPKSANIQNAAEELDLALDTFLFIDDSPLECAEVRAQCRDVAVLQLPPDASRALQALRHCWPLDIDGVTCEGIRRTAMYHEERLRRELRRRMSLAEFIDRLELRVDIRPAEPADRPRMVDLMRRTTQFNLTGRRYSAAELAALPASVEQQVVDVRDRFGQYGTVGLMMSSVTDMSLTVTVLLLSCRALGRGVEHRMLAHLGHRAVRQELGTIQLQFVAAARNQPAQQFLNEVARPDSASTDGDRPYLLCAEDAANLRYNPDLAQPAGSIPPVASVRPSTGQAGRPEWWWTKLAAHAAELTTAESLRRAIGGTARGGVDDENGAADERVVTRIWAELLQLDPGQVDRDFRSLGGGSLELVQLLARVYEEFKVELPVETLLDEAVTISGLAAMIRRLRASGSSAGDGGIPWVE